MLGQRQSAADLVHRLAALRMAGTVLQLGAHPDDEDTGMLVFVSRGLGARAVYWSATRGEGGQNRRGPEQEEALGVVRTWESLQARGIDGGEVLYGPFYDYGFSKHGEDALSRWGRDDLVREIVRAIRAVQPQVVVSRWSGGESDGHGQHQAIGLVADEAVEAAADPSCFTDLAEQGLHPWRAVKLYHSVAGDWQPGEASHFGEKVDEYERAGYVRIDTGELDRAAGMTYQELAHLAVDCHRSQGLGFVPRPGPYHYYYRLVRSLVDAAGPDRSFFDGLDPTLTGLADHGGAGRPALAERLEEARALAERAIEAYHPQRADDAGLLALEGARLLRALGDDLAEERLASDFAEALAMAAERKAAMFEAVGAECLGIRVECEVGAPRTTPGRPVGLWARVWNGGEHDVEVEGAEVEAPEGWAVEVRSVAATSTPKGTVPFEACHEVTAPAEGALSTPYWLREPRTPYRYAWPEEGPLGAALDPPLVGVAFALRAGGHRFELHAPALHVNGFTGGFRQLPLSLLPPLAVVPRRARELLPAAAEPTVLEVPVSVRCIEDDGATATITLVAPGGWEVAPESAEVRLEAGGDVATLRFEVTVPAGASPGSYPLRFTVDPGRERPGFDLAPIRIAADGVSGRVDEANCVAEAFLVRPAAVEVDLVDVEFVRGLRYAYVEGIGERIVGALDRFGLDVTSLTDEELAFADLEQFDAVVVGANAYNGRGALRRDASRLLDYVAGGGTLVVQYQAYGYEEPGLAPYPFAYHQPHDRVTAPDAPVDLLDPDHAVLHVPNRLSAADFDGWVHDRGLYFFGEWDERYHPVLASADAGEEPKAGGLLVAHHGRGTYVYAAYSFFRQIPAGVPGAIRLFANLLGLAEARIARRVALLRRVSLLDSLSDRELEDAAHAMAERTIGAGELLTRQGEPGTEMFVLLEGSVEVVEHAEGGERLLEVVEPVSSLGELPVLGRTAHTASLRARTDVAVLSLPGDDLHAWLRRHPDLSVGLLARMILARDAHR